MKNFTKQNFKQFTSRLSARWLIIALMMLVGTSSAWAAKLRGTLPGSDWNNGIQVNDNVGISINLDAGSTYEFKLFDESKNKWFRDQYAGTMQRDNCTNWEFNYEGDGNTKIYADISGTYIFTFKWSNSKAYLTVTYPAQCISCCTNYYLQHPWNGGNWTWMELKKEDCNNNIYTLTANYGNAGCDYSKPGVEDKDGYIGNPTLEGNPAKGDECIFSFDANNKTITITKVVKCETLTAPTLTVTNVKKCNDDYTNGKITISNYDANTYTYVLKNSSNQTVDKTYSNGYSFTKDEIGTYKVTMTRKDGTQCEAVTSDSKTIEITDNTPIGNFSVSSSAQSICSGTKVTLTATSVNGASYQWFLNGSSTPINDATKYQYEPTIEADATYKVVVSKTSNSCTATKEASVSVDAIPVASTNNFDITIPENAVYNGQKHSATATVKSGITGMGAVTVKHYKNGSEVDPIDAGDYVVKMSVAAGNSYCAMSETQIGTFTINKANQTTPTITANSTNICGKEATFAVSGGESTGNYSYTFDKNDANATREGTTLKATQSGSVTLKVKKSGDNNYNESSEAAETFNFTMPIENVRLAIIEGESATGKYCVGHQIKFQLTYTGSTPTFDTEHFSWILDNFESEISNNVGGIASGATWTTTLGANDTSLKLKLKDCNESWKESTPITFEVYERPSAPVFNPNSITVCQGQPFTLPGSEAEGYIWSDATGKPTTPNKPNGIDATAEYYAVISFGCPSPATKYTVTVNPLPAITGISVNNSTPVINEDVLLTVEGSDIARVEWSITSGNNASLSDASGNSVKLTSTASGAVTVTATAISSNGCRATSTKEVTFKAVDECEPTTITVPANYIEIYCKYNDAPTQYDMKVDIWKESEGQGTESYQSCSKSVDGYAYWKFNITDDAKYCIRISNREVNYKTGSMCTLTRGHKYYFDIPGNWSEWTGGPNQSKTEDITETQDGPPAITTPAVKTVSATSEEGSGIVTFTGKVLKTGCANGDAIWVGYQYKKANEAWPTTGVTAGSGEKQLVSIGNNPGSEDFTVNVEGLNDGDYHFRAYIINGYNFTNGNYDQGVYYGLDKFVTVSTVKTPVKTATITLTDAKGDEVDKNKKYCVGETGYIKVTSDVKYTTIKWKTDKGTEIEETGNNGVYSFVAKGDDNIWVKLSNKHNDIDKPAINEEPLVVNTFADPILPRVSLNKVSICSDDEVGATVKLTNVVKGQTYQLYQQIENAGGSFTEQAIGEAKTQTEEVTDKTELVLHTLNNTYTTGKYFVKTYTSDCEENIVATQPFTFTVVDAAEVFINIEPTSAETTPWMPAKFTVNASDKYTLNVTKGNPAEPATEVEVNQNGNKVSVKIPLPKDTQHVTGQYQNVTFPQGATTQYTITATLSATGGDNPCAAPASATINLVPYVEECTIGH